MSVDHYNKINGKSIGFQNCYFRVGFGEGIFFLIWSNIKKVLCLESSERNQEFTIITETFLVCETRNNFKTELLHINFMTKHSMTVPKTFFNKNTSFIKILLETKAIF